MNPVERTIRNVDKFQQRHTPAAFVFGIIKKYGDDNGGVLVANLAYSGFVSLFPLLLVLTTILGLVAASSSAFRADALKAVSNQIPLIGNELTGNVHELRRSSIIGLIIGLLGLIYGGTGLAQAGLFAMEQAWNLPGPARPGYFPRMGRALLFLSLLGGGVIATTLLVMLNSYAHNAVVLMVVYYLLTVAVSAGMYLGAYRVLTPKGVPTRRLLPGAVTAGILYTLLQLLGTYLVHHFLHTDSVYGVFATVLGLMAWIYLTCEITVYCAEINVVLARRLWPRAIVQPPLTEADRASMALQALQNQRRPEQQVEVSFNDREPDHPVMAPRTPEEVAPPANAPVPGARGEPDGNGSADRQQG
ncbi:MAG: YihY/virulence factor BrkB family protein [Streptosporangiaceae bacterium]|nr:YihY/virulence factor BrkB family protein [Streptosporangiaceae bacterium]